MTSSCSFARYMYTCFMLHKHLHDSHTSTHAASPSLSWPLFLPTSHLPCTHSSLPHPLFLAQTHQVPNGGYVPTVAHV